MDSSLEGHLHRRCGGRYQSGTETVTIRVSGMAASVERALFRCAKCGDEQRTIEQREAAEQVAVTRMRETNALLTPKAIRQLREGLGLTPHQMGELLYGTPKGIVEGWEKGRYLQNTAVDAMLRSLTDPEELRRRAAKANVKLPAEVAAEAAAAEAAAGAATGAALAR